MCDGFGVADGLGQYIDEPKTVFVFRLLGLVVGCGVGDCRTSGEFADELGHRYIAVINIDKHGICLPKISVGFLAQTNSSDFVLKMWQKQ